MLTDVHGFDEARIQAELTFNFGYFSDRVRRLVPKPSVLHRRVKAVFLTFGHLVDPKTRLPLFNQQAWKKATNVLDEIKKGLYSDIPGVPLYRQKLDGTGEAATNTDGVPLWECVRGTNMVEAIHRSITRTFGTWHCGTELCDAILAEFRHRHNYRMAVLHRPRTPMIGHFDGWLVDKRQMPSHTLLGCRYATTRPLLGQW